MGNVGAVNSIWIRAVEPTQPGRLSSAAASSSAVNGFIRSVNQRRALSAIATSAEPSMVCGELAGRGSGRMLCMGAKVWLGPRLVEAADAVVSVADRGFTSGDGVFETLKVVNGAPFAVTRHLARLQTSAEIVGIPMPEEALVRTALNQTVDANVDRLGPLGRARITLTAGVGTAGFTRSGTTPTLVITVDPQPAHPAAARVVTVPWPHNERALLVGAKATSYAENLAILERVRAAGADEALLQDTQGRLCEGTTCNVIVALGGRLITPSLATGCLGGVTRSLILEWGLAVEEDIAMAALSEATEVLLSSSTRNMVPVTMLDGRILPAPGPLGAAAAAAFTARAATDMDP